MRKEHAFTLIEVIMYLGFLSLISFGIFYFFVTFQKDVFLQNKLHETTIRNTLILDLLKRDIISASMSRVDWRENKTFMKKTIDKKGRPIEQLISWDVVKKGVRRKRLVNNRWHTNFFGSSITKLELQPHGDGDRVRSVDVLYQAGKEEKMMVVRLRNRMLT